MFQLLMNNQIIPPLPLECALLAIIRATIVNCSLMFSQSVGPFCRILTLLTIISATFVNYSLMLSQIAEPIVTRTTNVALKSSLYLLINFGHAFRFPPSRPFSKAFIILVAAFLFLFTILGLLLPR